jgi:hypothetical protein
MGKVRPLLSCSFLAPLPSLHTITPPQRSQNLCRAFLQHSGTKIHLVIFSSATAGTVSTATSTARVPGLKSTTSQASCSRCRPPRAITTRKVLFHTSRIQRILHAFSLSPSRPLAAPAMAPVVGALPNEVSCMNGLTANLHLLLVAFYSPTASRYKIIMEAKVATSVL